MIAFSHKNPYNRLNLSIMHNVKNQYRFSIDIAQIFEYNYSI